MTQPNPQNSSYSEHERDIADYILAQTNNGRDLLDFLAKLAQGDYPEATREDRIEAAWLLVEYQDHYAHLFEDPQSP